MTRNRSAACTGAILAAIVCPAHADDLGFDWVTIGDPGNRAASYDEAFLNEGRGSVGYEYRLTRTEVTVAQHLAFLQAIEPFVGSWDDDVTDSQEWLGHRIGIYPHNGAVFAAPGWENTGTTMSFYTAARFCNWLHNGQVNEAWAFESGAYDISTFRQVDADGQPIDQLTHSEGARYWIPNLDEWIKGMYWDPTKDGEGGYWQYQHMSDEPPVPGLPGEPGAQTSAGPFPENGPKAYYPIDVGSYPDAASYFGLLDGSGGVRELMEADPGLPVLRAGGSSRVYDAAFSGFDYLSSIGTYQDPDFWRFGFRLASPVPAPGALAALLPALLTRRRRR